MSVTTETAAPDSWRHPALKDAAAAHTAAAASAANAASAHTVAASAASAAADAHKVAAAAASVASRELSVATGEIETVWKKVSTFLKAHAPDLIVAALAVAIGFIGAKLLR